MILQTLMTGDIINIYLITWILHRCLKYKSETHGTVEFNSIRSFGCALRHCSSHNDVLCLSLFNTPADA